MSSIFKEDPSQLSLGTKLFPELSLTKAKWAKPPKQERVPNAGDTENRKLDAERRRLGRGGRNATWMSEAAAPVSSSKPIATLTGLAK